MTATSRKKSRKKKRFKPQREDHLDRNDLLELELAVSRLESTLSQVGIRERDIEILKVQHAQAHRKLKDEVRALKGRARVTQEGYEKIRDEIAERYGFDMTRIVYDSETGRVTLPMED